MMIHLKALFVALAFIASSASAAVVQSVYTPLGGSSWRVDFTVHNDGAPITVGEFTIYFNESLYAGLSLAASPVTWDSLVIDSDPSIPAAGFLDAFAIDPNDALSAGEIQGGFAVNFTYLGQGSAGGLPFDVVDSDFQVIFSGFTTVVTATTTVPEPAAPWLVALGVLAIGATRRWAVHYGRPAQSPQA